MNGEGRIYSRVFGRDPASPMSHLSMDALQSTMKAVLAEHRKDPKSRPEKRPPSRWAKIDDIPAFKREFKGKACIHCHQVNDYDRADAFEKKSYSKSLLWVWPPPQNWGISLDKFDSTKIAAIKAGSIAEAGGLKVGDRLKQVGDVRILSQGDLFFAMNFAPERGDIKVMVDRVGKEASATLKPAADSEWRKSDVAWRPSLEHTPPAPGFWGKEISAAADKKKLGLAEGALAIRVEEVETSGPAGKAGLKKGDVVVAIARQDRAMDSAHMQAYFRTQFTPGDAVELKYLRDGKELKGTLALPK